MFALFQNSPNTLLKLLLAGRYMVYWTYSIWENVASLIITYGPLFLSNRTSDMRTPPPPTGTCWCCRCLPYRKAGVLELQLNRTTECNSTALPSFSLGTRFTTYCSWKRKRRWIISPLERREGEFIKAKLTEKQEREGGRRGREENGMFFLPIWFLTS